MTQHMQEMLSTAVWAEQRQELLHSQWEGRGAGLAQAAHRHLPHTTLMIESGSLGELRWGLWGAGGLVITDELVRGSWLFPPALPRLW